MTTACNFTSIPDFLYRAEAGSLNITETVRDCVEICALAWGSGNPDLSGIGAFVSYIFQTFLTVIFGPVFVYVYYLVDSGKWVLEGTPRVVLGAMHNSFLEASAGFSIPVAIATAVRLKQSAPFYEIAFMESMTTMQFLSLLSTSIAMIAAKPRQSPLRMLAIAVICIVEFGLYMSLVSYLRTSLAYWRAIQDFGAACKDYGSILPGFESFRTVQPAGISAAQYFNPFDWSNPAEKGKMIGMVWGFMFAAIVGLFVLGGIVYGLGKMIQYQEPISIGLISLGLTIGSLYCTVQMARKRDIMRDISGPDFEDEEWGFGQVIAIFIWTPLAFQAMSLLLHYLVWRSETRGGNATRSEDEQQTQVHTARSVGPQERDVGREKTEAAPQEVKSTAAVLEGEASQQGARGTEGQTGAERHEPVRQEAAGVRDSEE